MPMSIDKALKRYGKKPRLIDFLLAGSESTHGDD